PCWPRFPSLARQAGVKECCYPEPIPAVRPVRKEPVMNLLTWTYAAYVALSALVTIWVAQTLHARGRVFLVKNFHGDELLADSVNHLLVVGFYLLNFGYVALALKYGDKPTDL